MVSTATINPLLGISVFPNPFLDKISVSMDSDIRLAVFSLFDQLGTLVLRANLASENDVLTTMTLTHHLYHQDSKIGIVNSKGEVTR